MSDVDEAVVRRAVAAYRVTPLPGGPRAVGVIRTTVRRRRRLRMSAVSLATVLAIAIPMAVFLANPGHSPTPSASSTPSGSATSSTAPTPSASPSRYNGANPFEYVPQAWLPADQLPFYSIYLWRPDSAQPTQQVAASGSVSTCEAVDQALLRTGGIAHWQLWAFHEWTTGGQPSTASLAARQFFYPDAAAASRAYQQIVREFPKCARDKPAGLSGPLTGHVDTTATVSDGFAFVHNLSSDNGQRPVTASYGPFSHVYVVRRGNVIETIIVSADVRIDVNPDDGRMLVDMAQALCQLAPGC